MGFNEPKKVEVFLSSLQQDVRNENKKEISKMIHYPLRVFDKKIIIIRDPKEFLSRFDMIFSKEIREAILTQRFDALFVNSGGIMIGAHGEIWLDAFHGDDHHMGTVLIKTINHFKSIVR